MIAAVNRIRDVPIVYTVASDPVALGIFTKDALPSNLAGVHDNPALGRLLEMAMANDPGLESVGIVYDPAQPNSMLSVERLRPACAAKGIRLNEATASVLSDLSTAVQSLVQRGTGALILSADNLVTSGFSIVHKTAAGAGMPIFVTEPALVEEGATGAIGDDYEAWGAQSGRLAAKVLAGVPPGELSLETTRVQHVISPQAAAPAPSLPPESPR